MPEIRNHKNDLPDLFHYNNVKAIAIDTETAGLHLQRDRLCVVQISPGDGSADIIQIEPGKIAAPNLQTLLQDSSIEKIFHYGRFDIAILLHNFGSLNGKIFCTKIASRLVRTYTDKHGLSALCQELLGIQLSKQSQCSDWARPELTQAQIEYAAADVLYLHALREVLQNRLERENRDFLAQACFDFLPARAALDLYGWSEEDIFAHK